MSNEVDPRTRSAAFDFAFCVAVGTPVTALAQISASGTTAQAHPAHSCREFRSVTLVTLVRIQGSGIRYESPAFKHNRCVSSDAVFSIIGLVESHQW